MTPLLKRGQWACNYPSFVKKTPLLMVGVFMFQTFYITYIMCIKKTTFYSPYFKKNISVPCGQCYQCINTYRSNWLFRCHEEYKASKQVYFVTLTVEDDAPILKTSLGGQLYFDYFEIQKFFKRLRKRLPKFRYFGVYEYGSHTHRPHFHVNFFFMDDVSQILEPAVDAAWTYGQNMISFSSQARFAYSTKDRLKNLFFDKVPYVKTFHFSQIIKHLPQSVRDAIDKDLTSGHYKNLFEAFCAHVDKPLILSGTDTGQPLRINIMDDLCTGEERSIYLGVFIPFKSLIKSELLTGMALSRPVFERLTTRVFMSTHPYIGHAFLTPEMIDYIRRYYFKYEMLPMFNIGNVTHTLPRVYIPKIFSEEERQSMFNPDSLLYEEELAVEANKRNLSVSDYLCNFERKQEITVDKWRQKIRLRSL